MNYLFTSLIIASILFYLVLRILNGRQSPEKPRHKYHYRKKTSTMTAREQKFYARLLKCLDSRFIVAPQVHLSAIVDHKIKGQNWKAAFKHINGKSVDFLLISRKDFSNVCAIELDDATHDKASRSRRDEEVERILKEAKLPLLRIRQAEKLSDREIVSMLAELLRVDKP